MPALLSVFHKQLPANNDYENAQDKTNGAISFGSVLFCLVRFPFRRELVGSGPRAANPKCGRTESCFARW